MTATPAPLPDYTTWSEADLITHINALNAAYTAKQQAAEATESDLRDQIGATISDLAALIGPDNPTKGEHSLTEANLFTPAELGAVAGVALDKILAWMLVMARAQLATSRIVSGVIN